MSDEEVSRVGLDADRISFFADRMAEVSRIKWVVYHEGSDEDVEDLASYAGEVVELRRSATALAEAQAEIARLKARADRMEERIKVALFGLRGHEVLAPHYFNDGNHNDLVAVALWDLCKASVAALTDKPDAGEG